MGIMVLHLREIIRETLGPGLFYNPDAEEILVAIAAHESHLGYYLRQHPEGPATGIFGMELDTLNDLYESWLFYRKSLLDQIHFITGISLADPYSLKCNIGYQIITARLQLRRKPERLPGAQDLPGMAQYWKKNWNTEGGKGNPARFKLDYKRLVLK